MSTKMAKHGKELSDDTNKTIINLIESGHRASQDAQSLAFSESTISRLLKRWRIRGDTENIPRAGSKKIVTKRAENTLYRVLKTSRRATLKDNTAEFNDCTPVAVSRRATLKDITAEFNDCTPVAVSRRTVQRKLHFIGYTRRSVRKKIGIRTVNKKKRIAWCRGKLYCTVGNRW
jgi:transposase